MKKEKTLSLFDLIGMALAAFISVEVISSQASLGASVIPSFIFFGGLFVFSHCALCAELGSAYPDQGGLYVWVHRGMGDKWAARTNWWYWVNVIGFVPSVMIPTISILKQLFMPDMSVASLVICAIIGTWLVLLAGVLPLKNSKLLATAGTIAKLVFCLSIVIGAIFVAFQGNSQTVFNFETMTPKFDLSLLALVPTFTYSFVGMDLIGSMGGEMKNPKKDMPRAMVVSTLVAFIVYILSIVSLLIILPEGGIDETTGLIDAVISVYGASRFVIIAMGICLALVYFSNAFAWPLAASKVALEAAEAGEFPKIFLKTTKSGAPFGSTIILGISSTFVLLFYGMVAHSNEGLFWTVLAFAGILFFLPYIMISFAFLKLRKIDGEHERPFKIKGKKFPQILAWFHAIMLIGSAIFFLIPPEGENPVLYVGALVLGLLVTEVIGEFIINRSFKTRSQSTR